MDNNKEFVEADSFPQPLNCWASRSSWLKFHDRYCIEENKYFVYPYYSISTNFSDAGIHSKSSANDSQVRMQSGKKHFNFARFNEKSIIYDEFMEREFRNGIEQISFEDLTVDLYGNKNTKYYKRYVLTTRILDYSILKSYKLALKPIELSVIEGIDGYDIFLYDTQVEVRNKQKIDRYALLRYSTGISAFHNSLIMLKFSVSTILRAIIDKI